MGTRITGGVPRPELPEVEVGCLNRAHAEIVNFKIPYGKKSAKCPVCGRRAGRK